MRKYSDKRQDAENKKGPQKRKKRMARMSNLWRKNTTLVTGWKYKEQGSKAFCSYGDSKSITVL